MITQTEKKYYTPEEYFEHEETAEYRSEYYDGEIAGLFHSQVEKLSLLGMLIKLLLPVAP